MNKIVQEYINYGIYKNAISFPYNEQSIIKYINTLTPIGEEILKEDISELINNTKECDNIFIVSFITYTIGYNKELLNYLFSLIQNEFDVEIVVGFLIKIKNKKERQKVLKEMLNDNSLITTITEKKLIKKTFDLKTNVSKNRRKILNNIKDKLYDGTFKDEDIKLLQENNVHPDELSYYLSYTLIPNVKEHIFLYYLEKNNLQDIIFSIDKSYIQNIPTILLEKIEEKLKNIADIEQIIYLFIYNTKMANRTLKDLIEHVLYSINLNHFKTNNIDDIRIYINPKYNIYIDKEDKLTFLHYMAIYSSIIASIYNLPLYVNDVKVNAEKLEDKIRFVKNSEVSISYKNVACPLLNKSLVFSNIDISCLARWDLLGDTLEENSDNLVVSGYNTKNFLEVLSYLG